jgi:CubicO group peptidase (beta-lactamase class C family)
MKKQLRILIFLLTAVILPLVCISCGGQDDTAVVAPLTQARDTTLVDYAFLDTLVTSIQNGEYGNVHSVLIERRGKLVFERYFQGYARDDRHVVYSVTKSFLSSLIGVAIARGDLDGVDTRMLDFFPGYQRIANMDSLKQAITVEHLLTMTAGLEWDEWDVPYGHPDNDISQMYSSRDWVQYVLDLPMTDRPGTRFVYNSGASMLLSAILTEATGLSAYAYGLTHLFSPLGISDWTWDAAPSNPGMSIGGWGLHLRPIDMLKFGRLYLQKGVWDNDQVVPLSWVERSVAPHAVIDPTNNYGYQWWMYSDTVVADGRLETNDAFLAAGRGGQYIWVVPHLELVVVSTAWNDSNGKHSSPMFFRFIVPAVRAAGQ